MDRALVVVLSKSAGNKPLVIFQQSTVASRLPLSSRLVLAGPNVQSVAMMRPRTIRIVAIVLAIIVGLTTLLGYEPALEWQHVPPAYSPSTIDV